MKYITLIFAFLLLKLTVQPALAQGTFQNLNFEASTVSPLPSGQSETSVPVSAAFPGWTAYKGTNVTPTVSHNGLSTGGVNVGIIGPSFSLRLQANFSALLQAGGLFSSFPVYSAGLAQTGTVPTGVFSVMFFSLGDRPEVTFNGQVIPTTFMGNGVSSSGGATYEVLGGDVAPFAGQSGELRFTSYAPQGQFGSYTLLDNIFFSNQQVPEPSTLGVLGLGVLLFSYRLRHRN